MRGAPDMKLAWLIKVAGGETLEARMRPYQLMGRILKDLDRDVVFNLCQYGMSEVWKWGAEGGGHCWRTTRDLGLEKRRGSPASIASVSRTPNTTITPAPAAGTILITF
jgi:hypothetical protein